MKKSTHNPFPTPAGKGGKTTNALIPAEKYTVELELCDAGEPIEHEPYIGDRANHYHATVPVIVII